MLKNKLLVLLFVIIFIYILDFTSLQASELMKQAADFYAQRSDINKVIQAIDIYDKVLQSDYKNDEAAWHKSRALYWLGTHVSKENQVEFLERAIEAAKQAITINPQSLSGHYWLGVCYGIYGKTKGIMKSLSLVDSIKEEMNFIIKNKPDYEEGGPYRVLGRLYHKLPAIVGGSNSKALEYLKKAVELGPNRWINHLYLAELYLSIDKKIEAQELLKQIIVGPAQVGFEPEYFDWKIEAIKLFEANE